jgi:zinc protease
MPADIKQFAGLTPSALLHDPFDCSLRNGVRVVIAQCDKSPLIEFRLVTEGGFATDPPARTGLAGLATAMFRDGLLRINDFQLGCALEALGALTYGQVAADTAILGMSALNTTLADSLRIYVDALMRPEFRREDLELIKANRIAIIASERLDPFALPLRVLPRMVYGVDHSYAQPFTGSGSEEDIAAVTGDDLRCYYEAYLTPERISLVVAGSDDSAQLRPRLEQTFGQWRAEASNNTPTPMQPAAEGGPEAIIVDHPGASQTVVATGLRTVARNSPAADVLMVADTILAGIFTSRLNLNLREHKGWTYGVHSSLLDARRQGLWLIRTAVRADRTAQAMAEIACEIENMAGRNSPTNDEFARAVDYLVARIPCRYETCAQIADALAHAVIYGLPVTYPRTLASRLRGLTPEDVTEACRRILEAGHLRWLVVGDAAQLDEQLRHAGFANVMVVELSGADVP